MTVKPSAGVARRQVHVVVGIAICVAVTTADLLNGRAVALIPLIVLAPLVVSARGVPRETAGVAIVATAMAVALGWIDDIAWSEQHWVSIATTVLGGSLAVWLAAARDSRDQQLAASLPAIRAADRRQAALTTGRMGEWAWDRLTGEVTWDSNVAELFGVDEGRFGGTFAEWIGLIDERDRQLVQRIIDAAVADRQQFRFDHRCVWPDGTLHWIEGIGDVVLDDDGQVVGAFGLAVDVDERHRQIEERTRLVDFERSQRRRVEFLDSIHDVLAMSVDIGHIVQRITAAVIPDLAQWCSIVVSIDRPRAKPSITVAHADPDKVRWAEQVQLDYPYDPDAPWGAAEVIRSRRTEFVPRVDPMIFSLPGGDVLAKAGLSSVITVPLVGPLGTLGAMQLIRGADEPPFSTADLEFVDELAIRVGAALNTAVLFQRQARGRAALDTLQHVSGQIASVATIDEVVHAALEHGAQGIGAVGGALFLIDANGALTTKETTGADDPTYLHAEMLMAEQAISAEQIVIQSFEVDGGDRVAIGIPMQIMNRVVGSVVFTFAGDRELTPEESSMLATIGSRCAGALERASLYERERTVALTLQHRLLSTLPATPDWIEVASAYVPASGLEIGGDWFQLLDARNGCIAAVVGDAVGHGIASAAAMGQLRASIATAVANDPDPDRALAAVDLFAGRGADTLGASVAYVLFQPDGIARHASAGHMPVIWVPAAGPARLVEGGRGPLLGFRANTEPAHDTLKFLDGDVAVMYTDGLIERRTEAIDTGLQRLLDAVELTRHLPPREMCDALVAAFTNHVEPKDDIALLILRRTQAPSS